MTMTRWSEFAGAAPRIADLRGQRLDPFFAADITGASAVEVGGGHMDVMIWKPGEGETVLRKH